MFLILNIEINPVIYFCMQPDTITTIPVVKKLLNCNMCVKFASCNTFMKAKAKVPYTCHEGIWGSGSIAPPILNISTRWS
jgi:hypothetical protein